MTPRKTPTTEDLTTAEMLEAIRDLSKRLEDATGYMEIIADNIEGIKSEISWLLDNRESILPFLLRSMPADPTARPFTINQATVPPSEPETPLKSPQKGTTTKRTSLFPQDE